jgi:hypothetical protein
MWHLPVAIVGLSMGARYICSIWVKVAANEIG